MGYVFGIDMITKDGSASLGKNKNAC